MPPVYLGDTLVSIEGSAPPPVLPTVSVAASPSTILEDAAETIVFTFTRSATTGSLAVDFSIGGTAVNGTDYATIASPVIFAAGSATATVTVDPSADATFEDGDAVLLTVLDGNGYIAGSPAFATGTILNDDAGPVPAVSINVVPSSVSEDGTTNLVFEFSRTIPTGLLTVNYTVGGTATNGTDYSTIGTTVEFLAGASTATVTVNPTPDATTETGGETVVLTVANGSGYTVGSPSVATGTITESAASPSLPAPALWLPFATDLLDDSANALVATNEGLDGLVAIDAGITTPIGIGAAQWTGGQRFLTFDSPLLSLGAGDWSITAFVRSAQTTDVYPAIVARSWNLFTAPFYGEFGFASVAPSRQINGPTYTPNTWYRVTARRLGNTLDLFVNNTITDSLDVTGADFSDASLFRLGNRIAPVTINQFEGHMRDVVVLVGTALTDAQILYLQTNPYEV